MAASVRHRLLYKSREKGEDFNFILTRYALERLLYRIGVSEYSEILILKGALLFSVWIHEPYRPTRDMDLLKHGESSPEAIISIFRDICSMSVMDDGLTFDLDSIKIEQIRKDKNYQGQRLLINTYLEKARIRIQVDIGFGDAIVPPAQRCAYPALLDLPAPNVWMYSMETVIAEKLEALVSLGAPNSRMKDFFDLYMMSTLFVIDRKTLCGAIKSTFKRRGTLVPKILPAALGGEFVRMEEKTIQWNAFLRKNGLRNNSLPFPAVMKGLKNYYWPLLQESASA